MNTSVRNRICTLVALGMFIAFLKVAEMSFDAYTIQIMNLIAINAILVLSLNLIYGFTGMFSLGHAGFMAIGAYVCTIFILTPEQKDTLWILEEIYPPFRDASLPFLVAVFAGGIAAAIAGIIIAVPVLRLGGDYLGIATLGFAEIIRVIIANSISFTNGSIGLTGIPQYATLWVNFGWLLFVLYFIISLLRSNVGNVFRAIRENEIAAKTMGINTFYYRVLSFALGAFFAGIAGALNASLISTIDPKVYVVPLTFNILMIVVAGGLGSITGSIISSIGLTIMLEWLRIVEEPISLATAIGSWLPLPQGVLSAIDITIPGIPGMRMVIFSILLMCIILFRQRGLMGRKEFTWDAIFSWITSLTKRLRKREVS